MNTLFASLLACAVLGAEDGELSAAVRAVEEMGGSVHRSELPTEEGHSSPRHVVSVSLYEFDYMRNCLQAVDNRIPDHVDPSVLQSIGSFKHLERLFFGSSRFIGDKLKYLSQLTNLHNLDLTCPVSRAELKPLAGMTSLEVLRLHDTRLQDEDIDWLLQSFPKVRYLDVSSSCFTIGSEEIQKRLSRAKPEVAIQTGYAIPRLDVFPRVSSSIQPNGRIHETEPASLSHEDDDGKRE